ncbi:MAG: vitamin B12 receptor [Marinilabiliales bacterium]|nr:MAG: vitamin B12 receptor [Marinilabiliales bacterium]
MENLLKSNSKKTMLIFKRWNRKGYSVFNTIGKVIKITTLTLSYSIVLLPLQALSQTDTTITKNLDLEEVVVSAQRAPVIYSQLSRSVTVVDEDEIKLMPVQTVNELLENFSGMDIRQRGVNGMQSDISIRGGSFDQNLILLNGVNITDPQTGHHSLNLPIDLNSVERIEILEGSGSRIFGPNAFSGAINIITNHSSKNYLKASFTAGDFGLFSGNLTSSYMLGKTRHFLSISKSLSSGYKKNTDFDQYNIFYNSSYNSELGKIDFQLGYSDKEFGANSFYTPAYPDQFEETKTTFTSLKFETGEKIKLIPSVYFRRHQDKFELFRYEPASWYTGHNFHLTDVYGVKIDSRVNTNIGVTSFGAELRSENIWSNVLGELINDTIQAIGESEGFYSRNYSRTISNYFMEQSLFIGRFNFSAGVLASWVSENNFDFNIYPGFDLGYSIGENIRSYISINKSLRLPTFTDLFYNGPSNIGNPNLVPEEAWSYEFGLKYNGKLLHSDLTFFYRDASNVIEWVRDTSAFESEKWITQNLTNVITKGFTFKSKLSINMYTIDFITINYTFLDQDASANDGSLDTKYSLNYLKHNLFISFNQDIYKSFKLFWAVKFQDREGSYLGYDFNINDYVGDQEFNPYWLLDAKISYQFKMINTFMEASNVFNKQYSDFGNIYMPGRWFKAGLIIKIDY